MGSNSLWGYCRGGKKSRVTVWGQFSRGDFSGAQLSRGKLFRVNCPGAKVWGVNCPGENFHRGHLFGGEAVVLGEMSGYPV